MLAAFGEIDRHTAQRPADAANRVVAPDAGAKPEEHERAVAEETGPLVDRLASSARPVGRLLVALHQRDQMLLRLLEQRTGAIGENGPRFIQLVVAGELGGTEVLLQI